MGGIAEAVMVVSDSLQNANVTFTRRKVRTGEQRRETRIEGRRERDTDISTKEKNDRYEAVMCQVDRFFLLLASFARHILGDDDNASVALVHAGLYLDHRRK